jgi:predicted hydrocarbon binding protein
MAPDSPADQIRKAEFYLANRMGRMYLQAFEDVVGRNGLNAILNAAGLRTRISNYPPDNLDLGWSFREMSAISQALDDQYGKQGGRGIAIRGGRAWFHYAQKDFEAVLGIGELASRLLPLGAKLKMSLNVIADTFNKTGDQIVRVEGEDDRFFYHIERCPECWGRSAEAPVCHANLGLLQEALHRASGGRTIRVAEILCIARGDDSCTYQIDRRATD